MLRLTLENREILFFIPFDLHLERWKQTGNVRLLQAALSFSRDSLNQALIESTLPCHFIKTHTRDHANDRVILIERCSGDVLVRLRTVQGLILHYFSSNQDRICTRGLAVRELVGGILSVCSARLIRELSRLHPPILIGINQFILNCKKDILSRENTRSIESISKSFWILSRENQWLVRRRQCSPSLWRWLFGQYTLEELLLGLSDFPVLVEEHSIVIGDGFLVIPSRFLHLTTETSGGFLLFRLNVID